MQPTPPLDTPPLLAAAQIRVLWDPSLIAEAVVLLDERLCIIRAGLSPARLAKVIDECWDDFWEEYGETPIDLLVAEILTGQRPGCPHESSDAESRPRPEDRH